MSFLDGLLGLNTNASANKQTGIADTYRQAVGDANNGTLTGYGNQANGVIQQYGTAASDSINSGTTNAANALVPQNAIAQGQIGQGNQAAQSNLAGSDALYAPYAQNGAGASSMYANALGLNGAAGNAAATSAFQASPGYDWQTSQATDAAARHAASLGIAGSGNTLTGITTLASNLANQEHSSWLDRLNGLQGTGLQATQGISGNNALAANFNYGTGTGQGALSNSLGTGLAGLDTSQGTQNANIFGGQGTALAGISSNLGNSLVNNNTATANAVNGMNLQNASSQDSTTNANNGIFSKLIGQGLQAGASMFGL